MMDYKADRKIRDFSGKQISYRILLQTSCSQFCLNQIFSGKTATSYLRTVLTTNLALSKIKEKYKGALIDLDATNSKW